MILILKNLWAHRKQNGWIFAEIAIITLLSWFMVDYLVVSAYGSFCYDSSGEFEKEHLCVGQFAGLRGDLEREVEERGGIPYEEEVAHLQVLKNKLGGLSEVQSVCLTYDYPGEGYHWSTFALPDDTLKCIRMAQILYFPNERFFETLGLQPIEGSPTAEVLSGEIPQNGVVITRSVAQRLFGTDQVVGKRLAELNNYYANKLGGEVKGYNTIVGVVEDVKVASNERYSYTVFMPCTFDPTSSSKQNLLLRLKPDVDAEEFVKKHQPTLTQEFHAGIRILATLETYNQHLDWQKKRNRNTIISQMAGVPLVLFAIIVVLGTLGTYWLQIRKRREDIGIMRAFGASKMRIFWTFLAEGAILTLLATFVGDIIWLQFIASWPLLSDGNVRGTSGLETDWVTQFWPHFIIISLIVYLLLLVIVSLGIALPAWNICRKKIVTALRDE